MAEPENLPDGPDAGADDAPSHSQDEGEIEEEEARPAPMIDYNRPFAAEEAASSVLRKIVNDGGQLLYEKYLERKTYPFAMNIVTKAVMSRTLMCFVAHELAEDNLEEWGLEEEPQPQKIDSWARMMLPKKHELRLGNTFTSSKDSFGGRKAARRQTGTRKASEAALEQSKAKGERIEGLRSWSLEEKPRIDPEEERHREEKVVRDCKNRENDRRKKAEVKAAEQERIRIETLHAEMDKKLHTFDTQGNVLWIEPLNTEKLPKVSETIGHSIGRDKKSEKDSTLNGSKIKFDTKTMPKPKAPRRKNFKKKEATQEFVDSFIPLKHQQPPILETIKMKPGVSLDHKGKSAAGPPRDHVEGKLSRKEYLSMSQREISGDTQLQFTASGGVRAVGGNSGNAPEDTTSSPKAQKTTPAKSEAAVPDTTAGNPARSDSLPALDKGRPPPLEGGSSPSQASGGAGLKLVGSGAGVAPGDAAALAGSIDGKKQTIPSPVAPPIETRVRKFDSVGHLGRPPRVHPPLLGSFSAGPKVTQPPLGATMGHGLLRTENSVEEFFFPQNFLGSPAPATFMPRSMSDSALPKDRKGLTKVSPGAFPPPPLNAAVGLETGGDDSPSRSPHGDIIPEQRSPAYRHVRKQLFPPMERADPIFAK